MNAIEVEKLSRAFNGLKAVDDISFSVQAGEIFGFLGHNGAGKTTTIRNAKRPVAAYIGARPGSSVIAFSAAAWALRRRQN